MKGKLETRKKILKAAKGVFLEKGFINSKIDDIAKLSKISHGTFYIYFKNKHELLYELVEETFHDFYTVTEEPWGKGDIYYSLEESIKGFLLTYQNNLAIIKAWKEVAATNESFMQVWDDLFSKITDRIEINISSSIRKGVISQDFNPAITAKLLSGMVEHAAFEIFIKGKEFQLDEASATLTKLWYNAIYKG